MHGLDCARLLSLPPPNHPTSPPNTAPKHGLIFFFLEIIMIRFWRYFIWFCGTQERVSTQFEIFWVFIHLCGYYRRLVIHFNFMKCQFLYLFCFLSFMDKFVSMRLLHFFSIFLYDFHLPIVAIKHKVVISGLVTKFTQVCIFVTFIFYCHQ